MSVAPATESAEPVLRLRGVGRRFGGVQAVRGVDLDVFPGERRAILGPNGAGKTTLFNLVSGEFPPTAGSIELFGRDVTRQPARKRAGAGLTRTYQTSRLFLGLNVEDNLYLAVLGSLGAGFALLAEATRSLRTLLFGVAPGDPLTIAAACAVLNAYTAAVRAAPTAAFTASERAD